MAIDRQRANRIAKNFNNVEKREDVSDTSPIKYRKNSAYQQKINSAAENDNENTDDFEEDSEQTEEEQELNNEEAIEPNESANNQQEESNQPKQETNNSIVNGAKNLIKKKAVAFIATNPYVLAIIAGVAFIFIIIFLIIIIFGGSIDSNENNSYDNNQNTLCSKISLNATSLSRADFISKLQASTSVAEIFKQNAGTIYDLASNNNVNPELVVVRAQVEGYSPGTLYQNYWGIGCTNTGGVAACKSYKSFSDGVLGFVNYVSQYNSIESLMTKYAYIGEYWYNPGSSAVGGCYYYPYIKQYMTESRAAAVGGYCSSDKACSTAGGNNCNKTTEEDQLAYTQYQISKMTDVRKQIFNLEEDVCKKTETGDIVLDGNYQPTCSLYNQSDPKWKSISLGGSSNMGSSGCAVTSLAMAISCYAPTITVKNFDAETFIRLLNSNSCFVNNGAIVWSCGIIKKIAPNISYVGQFNLSGSVANKVAQVQEHVNNKQFVLLHVSNRQYSTHFVLYDSYSNGKFKVLDPAGGKVKYYDVNDIKDIRTFSY